MKLSLFSFQFFKYLAVLSYFLGLFFGVPYAVYSIALVCLAYGLSLIFNGTKKTSEYKKALLLPIVFYIIHLFSWLYSDNSHIASFDIEVKLSFLILPILMGLKKDSLQLSFSSISNTYIIVSTLISIGYLGHSLLFYIEHEKILYYAVFSSIIHPSYLTLYLSTSLLFSIGRLARKRKIDFLFIVAVLFIIPTILFCQSKAGIIALGLLLGFTLLHFFFHRFKFITLLGIVVLTTSFFFFAKNDKRFKKFITATSNVENIFDQPENVKSSSGVRLLAWHAGLEVIKKNPVLGVGAGDIKNEMQKVMSERKYIKPLEGNLNCHNQYIETTVGQGIIGLLVLLTMLFIPLFIKSEHKFLIQGFILIFAVNLLFESMFNRQGGVVFFAFFYSLLLSQPTKTKSLQKTKEDNNK